MEGQKLRERIDRVNEKDAERQARLLYQQQRSIQKETECNHRLGAEADARRHPSPHHDADITIQLEAEELGLVINLNHEEVNQGRAEADVQRHPSPLHDADNNIQLEAEELGLVINLNHE